MSATIILYESPELDWLGPPASTRPVWDIALGPFTSASLLKRALPDADIHFWSRDHLQGLSPRPKIEADDVYLIDARLLPVNDSLAEALADLNTGQTLDAGDLDFARQLSGGEALEFLNSLDNPSAPPEPTPQPLKSPFGPLLRFWWEMPQVSAGLLLTRWTDALAQTGAKKVGEGELYLAPGAKVQPDVAISEGPILLDKGAQVAAQSYIGGPCYLGPGTLVRPQARLLHGVFAGPQCRLGGEIEESVFLGYANKQHDGFLGHAVIGEWVNLGAGTNNSDLKNNYSSVRTSWRGRPFETGQQLLGCCIGDHSKVAIGSRINTGSVLGSFCNWFGAGFPPKELSDFSWAGDGILEIHQVDKALATAKAVMARRDCQLDSAQEKLYRNMAEPSF